MMTLNIPANNLNISLGLMQRSMNPFTQGDRPYQLSQCPFWLGFRMGGADADHECVPIKTTALSVDRL